MEISNSFYYFLAINVERIKNQFLSYAIYTNDKIFSFMSLTYSFTTYMLSNVKHSNVCSIYLLEICHPHFTHFTHDFNTAMRK